MDEALDQTEKIAAELLAQGFAHPLHLPHLSQESSPSPETGSHGSDADQAAAARPGSAAPAEAALHPVLLLGWRRQCTVVCNGLRGEFLGGHDRDMFIQATSGAWAALPAVDASQGGSVLTCSQFEKAAGRELSKKWKESIHVVGEGGGSRSTLLSWLKRRGEREYGAGAVGRQVWVCWCADGEFRLGTITAYNRDNGKHTVQYGAPRLVEELHLPVERISFGPGAPGAAAASAGDQAAGGQLQLPTYDAAAPPLNHVLWSQRSDVSVRSCCLEERPAATLPPLGGGTAQLAGTRRPRAALRGADRLDLPPPKRAISAPAAVLLAAAAAAAAAEEGAQQRGSGLPRLAGGAPGPDTPSIQQARAPPSAPLPAPPPAGAHADAAAAEDAAVAWMHSLALCLEPELQELQPAHGLSLSGRFQTLLALARRDAAWTRGFSEAMAARHRHFAASPALQRLKMAEFVVAALHESAAQHEMQAVLAAAAAAPAPTHPNA